jgi:ribokinase
VDAVAGTGVASIIVEPDGANAILQAPRANRNVLAGDIAIAAPLLAGAEVAMLQLETSLAGAIAFARAAHSANARTLLNPAPAAPVSRELLALTDIIVPNEIEAEALTNDRVSDTESAYAAADRLRALGPRVAVVTLGDRGAIARSPDERIRVPALNVDVVDTVGAGDAFCAALAVSLAEGAELRTAVHFANAAGALACTKHGAEPSMPARSEVEALLHSAG